MKVSEIHITNFKRFKNIKITGLSQESKLVIIVGPNGCGKSSLFDAFHSWYKLNTGFGQGGDETYYRKEKTEEFNWNQNVKVTFHNPTQINARNKKCMYFRTAHRNDPDFDIGNLSRLVAPYENIRFQRFIDNDQAVSQNYQRLLYNSVSRLYSETDDRKTVIALREELIGKVRTSMENVFEDLILNNITDPLGDGAFFFEKGSSKSFHFKNLSGGEKSAFDLLSDLIIKLQYYDDTVFLIDEPELHMHTRLQGKLIKELYNLIPDNSQLWLTAHSLGVMRAANDLEKQNPGQIAILDFDGYDFDEECTISPVKTDRVFWEKFLSIALDDYSARIAPEVIILCEGGLNGSRRKNFDADIYNTIFGNEFPNITFISGGSCTDLEKDDHIGYSMLKETLKSSKILRLLDRDDKSDQEVTEFEKRGFVLLRRRHIESYLFDGKVIEKLVKSKVSDAHIITKNDVLTKVSEIKNNLGLFFENPEEDNLRFKIGVEEIIKTTIKDDHQKDELLNWWNQALEMKITKAQLIEEKAIQKSKERGNPEDDVKSASGEIYNEIKNLLSLTQCGNNTEAFMRDTLAPLITTEMYLYKQLKEEIIKPHI